MDDDARVPTSVYDHLVFMVDQMTAVSWQKLGLQHDTMTGQLAPNLAEAKVAIDVTAYLASVMEDQLDEDDRRRINGLVRDLRINYVQKTTEGGL
jgi:hypothetical protein